MYDDNLKPAIKRKNRPTGLLTGLGCALLLGIFVIGGAIGLLGGALGLPTLFGYDATAQALATQAQDLEETAIALAGDQIGIANTASYYDTLATQNAVDALATQAAQTNNQALINQTSTQSARNIIATQTASAVQDVQQRTQIAINFEQTQVALQAQATQVQLDFQQTQAVLGQTSNDANVRATSTSPPTSTTTFTATSSHTPSPTLTATSTPTATPFNARMTDDFVEDWILSNTSDWAIVDEALESKSNDAWLQSQAEFNNSWRWYTGFTPALTDNATYRALLQFGESHFALVIYTSGLTVERITLYEVEDSTDLDLTNATRIAEQVVSDTLLIGNTTWVITYSHSDATLDVDWNGEALFTHTFTSTLDASAIIGLSIPQGATLNQITVSTIQK